MLHVFMEIEIKQLSSHPPQLLFWSFFEFFLQKMILFFDILVAQIHKNYRKFLNTKTLLFFLKHLKNFIPKKIDLYIKST